MVTSTSWPPPSQYSKNSFTAFALVIGINIYAEKKSPGNGRDNNLGGAVPDAKLFRDWLLWRGAPLKNIILLTDKRATRAAIVDELKKLKTNNRIRRGDPIIIYFSGHGKESHHVRDCTECGQSGGLIQGIITHDLKIISGCVLGDLIGDIAKEKDNNIMVILDCCHSASGTRGTHHNIADDSPSVKLLDDSSDNCKRQLHNTRSYKLASAKSTSGIKFAHLSSMKSHVLLAACGRSRKSYENYRGGLFTAELLKVLYKMPLDKVRYSDIIGLMKLLKRQSPHCEGLHADRILFTSRIPVGLRHAIPVEYKSGTDGRPGKYIVHAGEIQQIKPQVQFKLFHQFDLNEQLGTLTIARKDDIYDFTSLATGILTPIGRAKLNDPDLKLVAEEVPNWNDFKLKVFCSTKFHHLNLDSVSPVNKAQKANIGVSQDGHQISFEIRSMIGDIDNSPWTQKFLVSDLGSDDIQQILQAGTHFFRSLYFYRKDPNILLDKIEFREVSSDSSTGSPKVGPNLFKGGTVSIPYKKDAQYEIQLYNSTKLDLYLSVFMFNVCDLSIGCLHTEWPNRPYKQDYSVLAGQELPVNLGTLKFDDLPSKQSRGVDYLKIYSSTEPVNLTQMCQQSPFTQSRGGVKSGQLPIPTAGRWAVTPIQIVVYKSPQENLNIQ